MSYVREYADYGNAVCKGWLGQIYRDGLLGVDKDLDKARDLFTEVAALDPIINVWLGRMAERGEGEPVDYAKARKLYRLSGTNAVADLGRLMEEGKGGPQDPSGAMTLYLETTEHVGDGAWKEVRRLRTHGQPLDEVQTKRYEKIWMDSFSSLQRRRLTVREVYRAVNAAGGTREVTLSYRFKDDSGVPVVTMLKGSGNAKVDQWVLRIASRLSMSSGPITDSSGVRDVQIPLTFSPIDDRKMDHLSWTCGTKSCR